MKQSLSIAVALLVGVGLGYLLFSGRGCAPRRGTTSTSSGPGKPTASGAAREVAGGHGAGRRHKGTQGPPLGLLRSVRQRNVRLARENKRLARRLSELEQDLLFARGKPVPWPRTVPGRFTRSRVVQAVNRALRQAGLDGEVTDVDCKEYPCVVSGNLKGRISRAQFQKLLGTRALRAYGDDHAQTSITTSSGNDSVGRPWARSHFAIALMLAGPVGTDPEVKRTVYRLRLLLDATTGQ